jgi:hypothetical protein
LHIGDYGLWQILSMAMQECPQTLPFVQCGAPPVAIIDDEDMGAGDCVGAVAGFGFIMPENIEGFLAGTAPIGVAAMAGVGVTANDAPPTVLHDIRLCEVGSWQ